MNLTTAQRYSEKIIEWLLPYCARIELAGSLRRSCPEHSDIDLLCIPKWEGGANLVLRHLCNYVGSSKGRARWRNMSGSGTEGIAPIDTDTRFPLRLPKCKLDVFCSNEERFASDWICYTGLSEHNFWLIDRSKKVGSWDPNHGLWLSQTRKVVFPQTEEAFYALLNLPFIPPEERTAHFRTCRK